MCRSLLRAVAMLVFSSTLTACGTTLPIMNYSHKSDEDFALFVRSIAQHVRCELRHAVATEYAPEDPNRRQLYDWAAKIALTIRAYDKGNFNPNVSWLNGPGILKTTVGVQTEANGTREMTMTYYLPFKELLSSRDRIDEAGKKIDCSKLNDDVEPIAGNLGIASSLQASLQAWDGFRTLSENLEGGPFETITHKVSFQVTGGMSATPTWTFTDVTVNPNPSILSATRTRTDELLITMGPTVLGTKKERIPSPALNEAFGVERINTRNRQ